MKNLIRWVGTFVFAFSIFSLAGDHADDLLPVGKRAMSRALRAELYQDIALRMQEEIEEEEGEEDIASAAFGVECLASDKIYYTTHDGVFHSPYKSGYVIIFADGCIEWVADSSYSLKALKQLYPLAVWVSWAVQLEDGSIWEIPEGDRYRTLDWFSSDSVVIIPNDSWFSSYDYKLVNRNTGVELKTNLVLGPYVNGCFTHWIIDICYATREIVLEDGSIWHVCGWYQDILNSWLPGDVLIIGLNDSSLTMKEHPNILINVEDQRYVNCNCIY